MLSSSSSSGAAVYVAGYSHLSYASEVDEEMNSLVDNQESVQLHKQERSEHKRQLPRLHWAFVAFGLVTVLAFALFAYRVGHDVKDGENEIYDWEDEENSLYHIPQTETEPFVRPLSQNGTSVTQSDGDGDNVGTSSFGDSVIEKETSPNESQQHDTDPTTAANEQENQQNNPDAVAKDSVHDETSSDELQNNESESQQPNDKTGGEEDTIDRDEDEAPQNQEVDEGTTDDEHGNGKENDSAIGNQNRGKNETSDTPEASDAEAISGDTDIENTITAQDAAGFKKPSQYYSDKYLPRARSMDLSSKATLARDWGSWTLVDSKAANRPGDEMYAEYPNRDVPRSAFPSTAWQVDTEYLSKFLPEAENLVKRAMEAIEAEYGYSSRDMPDKTEEERTKMFTVDMLDGPDANWPKDFQDNAGYSNTASIQGLKKRLLHSILSEDTFTFCMGGHSAAAGHGNHFQQSYTMQVGRVLEPIMARLGVYGSARNFGMGGLGTLPNAMAAGDIYGSDCDMLLWDSGMTEKGNEIIDVFARQGMLASDRIPFMIGTPLLREYHYRANVDVGMLGVSWRAGNAGIVLSESPDQVETLPWAMQYVECTNEFRDACTKNKYMGVCWMPRDDGVTPVMDQLPFPGGRAGWHPGNRRHQLAGRLLTYPILKALKEALQMWRSADGFALPDDAWHVTEMYNSQRASVQTLTDMPCWGNKLPNGFCQYPVKGRTEFTPRHNPVGTSIRSIIKASNSPIEPRANIYDPPDLHNFMLDPPEGAIDVLAIIENGVEFASNLGRKRAIQKRFEEDRKRDLRETHRRFGTSVNGAIVPGKGWWVDTVSAPDTCDGTYDSFCNRADSNDCLLSGHNDHRGGLMFDSYSGWIVLNLEDLRHGIIEVKIETWHRAGENPVTEGWCSENNETPCSQRKLAEIARESESARAAAAERILKGVPHKVCDAFQFDFAIDGQIETWDKATFEKNEKNLQRVVSTWTLMDDETYTDQPKDVELAIRMRGCKRDSTFQLTHVYWA